MFHNNISRLQLALTHATEHIPFFKEFENVLNGIYTFYMSRGHKNYKNLEEIAVTLKVDVYRLNYIYKVFLNNKFTLD